MSTKKSDDPYDIPGSKVMITCDCGDEHEGTVIGEEAQQLEWHCPVDKEIHSDVNA